MGGGALQRPRILVVRTNGAAGLVCTLPLLRALREGDASAWIGVLTTAALAPLLARHPHASEVLTWPAARGVVAPVRTLLALRARRLDDVILADANSSGRVVAAMRRIGAQRVIVREAKPGDA